MGKLKKHIFICTNERPPENPKGCCAGKGALDLLSAFKEEIRKRGLDLEIRAQKAGCLDVCAQGIAMVIYPEGVWYGRVTKSDINEIIDSHLLGDRPVKRLQIPGK